ncbi:MAG: RHS repeat domain-containing protein [Steroidobacteraceae bacterium]
MPAQAAAPELVANVAGQPNAHDERGQPIDEQLGNGARIISGFDSLTGLMLYRQTGTSAPYTNRQNLSFEWDLNGNLKKRIDGNQSNLTEEFFYDALNRFDYSTLNGTQNLDLALDAIGNITAKTSATDPAENIGTYTYHATKKHAVISTSNGWSFGYDANGNMNSYKGNSIAWTSYNLPSAINGAGQSSQFWYGPNRNRWKQVATYPSGSETTIYVGGILEKVTVPTGTGYRHYVGAGSAKVVYTRWSTGTENTKYVTTDHLNSSTVVMDSAGASLVNLSFAAFGARRGAVWSGTPSSGDWTQINNATRQGYTGHEHLDNINIVHMNGRVFDPALGRFLSADPFMPGSLGSQAGNRYAYVGNQPLSLIDPSGYWPRVGNALKAWRSDPSNADTISPWEEAAFMQAQLAWHQMFPGGGMVNGVPMMQTVTGRQVALARRDYGYVSASSLLPQYSFRSQTSVYIYPPGADVTEPIVIRVMGQENFWFPTGFGTMGQSSTTFQRPGTTQATPAPSNKPQPSPQGESVCRVPAQTDLQRSLSASGSRDAFFQSRHNAGDPFAYRALSTVKESDGFGQTANAWLYGMILRRNTIKGIYMSDGGISREMNQIGVELMQAYSSQLDQPGGVTLGRWTNIHHDVFAGHSLPKSAYGGTPFFGFGESLMNSWADIDGCL